MKEYDTRIQCRMDIEVLDGCNIVRRESFNVDWICEKHVEELLQNAAEHLRNDVYMARRSPDEWNHLIETRIRSVPLRHWVASHIWWDKVGFKTPNQVSEGWKKFAEKWVDGFRYDMSDVGAKALIEAMRSVDYPHPTSRVAGLRKTWRDFVRNIEVKVEQVLGKRSKPKKTKQK